METEDLQCDYCGRVYDNTDYVDVYKKPDNSLICERCIRTEKSDDFSYGLCHFCKKEIINRVWFHEDKPCCTDCDN